MMGAPLVQKLVRESADRRIARRYVEADRRISARFIRSAANRMGGEDALIRARELFSKTAGALTDVSHLRFQAVFLMGAGGSGKGFASHKWMKYMPGAPSEGHTREEMKKRLESEDYSEQERGLTNINFEKALERIRARGIDIEITEGGRAAVIPFRVYTYDQEGRKRLIPPAKYDKALPADVAAEIKGITEVVFEAPIHEIPSFWRTVDPDLYKHELAGFREEEPGYVHEMSSEMSKAYFEAVVESGDPLFVDGTGANLPRMLDWIQIAKNAGYRISLVLVWVPLTINHIRNAALTPGRRRRVDVSEVTRQWNLIAKNFGKLRGVADKSKAIDNRNDAADAKVWEKHGPSINRFIKKNSGGKWPDLYSMMKTVRPNELSTYGRMLDLHRAS